MEVNVDKAVAALFIECLLLGHAKREKDGHIGGWASHARTLYNQPTTEKVLEIARRIRESKTKAAFEKVAPKVADGTYFFWDGEWRKMHGRGMRKLHPEIAAACQYISKKLGKTVQKT